MKAKEKQWRVKETNRRLCLWKMHSNDLETSLFFFSTSTLMKINRKLRLAQTMAWDWEQRQQTFTKKTDHVHFWAHVVYKFNSICRDYLLSYMSIARQFTCAPFCYCAEQCVPICWNIQHLITKFTHSMQFYYLNHVSSK